MITTYWDELTPIEIDTLVQRLFSELNGVTEVIQARVVEISSAGTDWRVRVCFPDEARSYTDIKANAVFYAAGRLAEDLLIKAGAMPTEGKGLDIGIRLEFIERTALKGLRANGPDAKILSGQCRTFCLNVPGTIYRYPFGEISIPGGVVADSSVRSANVGVLLRVANKQDRLAEILEKSRGLHAEMLRESDLVRHGAIELPNLVSHLFSEKSSFTIQSFCRDMSDTRLIDFNQDYRIHLPLLDWHWHTFAQHNSHRTTLPNVFALGDSAGHARGLLQAALSGWLAAEEYLC